MTPSQSRHIAPNESISHTSIHTPCLESFASDKKAGFYQSIKCRIIEQQTGETRSDPEEVIDLDPEEGKYLFQSEFEEPENLPQQKSADEAPPSDDVLQTLYDMDNFKFFLFI